MVLLLVFMQLTRDLFAIAKFLLRYRADRQTDRQTGRHTDAQTADAQTDALTDADERFTSATVVGVSNKSRFESYVLRRSSFVQQSHQVVYQKYRMRTHRICQHL